MTPVKTIRVGVVFKKKDAGVGTLIESLLASNEL